MRKSCLLIVVGILLLGCSAPGPQSESTPMTESSKAQPSEQLHSPSLATPVQTSLGQTMAISAKAIIAGQEIQLEVARTPSEQAMGLMYRKSLPKNRGMLFPFNPPQPVNFWMKNTLIPLDMVFLHKGVVKAIATNVPPCTSDPCPTYGPGTTIDQVIELRGGRASELGLKVGDRVTIQKLDDQTSFPSQSGF